MSQDEKFELVRSMFNKPAIKAQFVQALPKLGLDVDRLLRIALSVMRDNPVLLDCTTVSLLSAILGGVQLGFTFEKYLGQAYLVPFKNSKTGQLEATLIPGYRGYIELAMRTGNVAHVSSEVVYEGDEFELEMGLNEKLRHVPTFIMKSRGNPVGAYVVVFYKDNSRPSFEWMPTDDIESIRRKSKAPNSPAWAESWTEMAKKTVIRRKLKREKLSVEIQKAVGLEEAALAGETQAGLLPHINGEAEQIHEDNFDKKIATLGLPIENLEAMRVFIENTANAMHPKMTAQQLRNAAVKSEEAFKDFMSAFEEWHKNRHVSTETPPSQTSAPVLEPRRKRGRPPAEKIVESKAVEIECPDDGTMVSSETCNACDKRAGCPAWEG